MFACAALFMTSVLLSPAHAGSEDDPEVRGESCGPETVQVRGEYTVCKAWFSATIRAPETSSLTGAVQVADSLEGRAAPIRVALTWRRDDGCREGWEFTDLLDEPDQLLVLRQCRSGPLVTAALDVGRAVVRGTDVSVDLSSEDLELVGSRLAAGERLSRPVASTRLIVRSSAGLVEASTLGQDAGPGRDYVLPS